MDEITIAFTLFIGMLIGMFIGTFIVDPLAKYMMKEAKKKRIERERKIGIIK